MDEYDLFEMKRNKQTGEKKRRNIYSGLELQWDKIASPYVHKFVFRAVAEVMETLLNKP